MKYNPKTMFKITDDGTRKTSEILEECKKKFSVWSVYDSDELDRNFPLPSQPTVRYFKKEVEAGDEKGKCFNDLETPEEFCTLRERLLMELQYFTETGKHLDIQNWTLCAGSRRAGGDVPGVCLSSDGAVSVDCWAPGRAGGCVRFRRAISLKTSPLLPSDLENRVVELEKQMKELRSHLVF